MNKKGQALVEFIIILPVLILLFFGAVDFGRIIIKKNELESVTNDVVEMYKSGSVYEELESYLKETDKNSTIKVTNKNNEYIEFLLESEIEFITPGLKKILGNSGKASVKRVIYYE